MSDKIEKKQEQPLKCTPVAQMPHLDAELQVEVHSRGPDTPSGRSHATGVRDPARRAPGLGPY